MKVIRTDELPRLDEVQRHFVYNGLDSAVTTEVYSILERQLDQYSQLVYNFERACLAPALEMMIRGIRVDQAERSLLMEEYAKKRERLERIFKSLCLAATDNEINPHSPSQVMWLLYERFGLPKQWKIDKGVRRPTVDLEALEKLWPYFYSRPIVSTLIAIRDVSKKLGVLHSGVDTDGRMRFSFNPAGTETGRWSSNKNAFGGGTNGQNITDELRRMFVPDPGYRFVYFDEEQAESRDVGFLCGCLTGNWGYLDACEGGDLHTQVCKLIWPKLAWTGDKKKDREVADSAFYRHFSHRDMAKRSGHGTNYMGTASAMARSLKIPEHVVAGFQSEYFRAFPEIQQMHTAVAGLIQVRHYLITPFGYRRYFFGREDALDTIKEGVAFVPQSSTGTRLNIAMLRIWRKFPEVELLIQLHDGVLTQIREEIVDKIIPDIISTMQVELKYHNALEVMRGPDQRAAHYFERKIGPDRSFIVPIEAQTGWNFGKYRDEEQAMKEKKRPNLNGLRKWPEKTKREKLGLLQQAVSCVY